MSEEAGEVWGDAVRDSRGRPCPVVLDVRTARPPQPVGPSRYRMPNPERLARGGESVYLTGGDFSPATVIDAYRAGYFPWPRSEEDERWWCSPNPRGVLPLGAFTITRRLGRTVRSGRFGVTVDAAFEAVIRACAERSEGTWITANLVAGYVELARLGWAHSFEVWEGEELVGGLYGVGVGAMFGAESMFSRVPDASKVAMVAMVQHCRAIGVELIDIQVLNEHTARMGGREIPRAVYLARLARALRGEAAWCAGEAAVARGG
ncbi:leucyl/phenylalanyl-tRNA--protein transferase [Tepidiforma sp.]|uniref:leucyl/phenylalanyl-tRNA--protein transferase n=1 Tax=Tepidiforma sp. TaxID=2682230 RepID=UPI002ADD6AA9|nr:leucyl/phenylalanyl-tRNA--protein transferase [Tepidiforma sp.]